jgi:integrase
MAVRKLKRAWWVDFRFGGERYRKRSPDNSRAGARVYESTLCRKLARGEAIDVDRTNEKEKSQPFETFAWAWFEIYVKNNNKPSEVRAKKSILQTHLVPFLNKIPFNRLSNLKIEEYKAKKIAEGLSNKTINNHLTVLSKCLRTAQDWLDLDRIPKIRQLKIAPQKFDFLSPEESELLVTHAEGVWREMIVLALRTGLRFGELRGLDWSDINWKTGIMTVRRSLTRFGMGSPKNNKERHIPLTGEIFRMLEVRRKAKGTIFTNEKGEPFEENRLRRALLRTCAAAGLRKIHWHVLRHTFASHLAMRGASIRAIQELLGHADIKTTLRYSHLTQSALRETISLLEKNEGERNFGQPAVNRYPIPLADERRSGSQREDFLANIKQKQEPKLLCLSGGDGGS